MLQGIGRDLYTEQREVGDIDASHPNPTAGPVTSAHPGLAPKNLVARSRFAPGFAGAAKAEGIFCFSTRYGRTSSAGLFVPPQQFASDTELRIPHRAVHVPTTACQFASYPLLFQTRARCYRLDDD